MRRSTHPLSSSSHPHHFESGMPVNLWGIDRRDVWRTCFCFHVRTATVVIGVVHLIVYILYLSLLAATLMYEPNQDGFLGVTIKPDTLPTPQSKISSGNLFPDTKQQPYSQSQSELPDEKEFGSSRNAPFTLNGMDNRKPNSQTILLQVCYMLITLLMVYGAVRGKPSYLMPFFVLKVFKFCIYCLQMGGYFFYHPNYTSVIANQPALPFRDELLRMDPQLLSLLALIVIVGNIAIRAYIIGVIWNCYKYLMLRNTVIRGVIAYRQDDPMHMLGMHQNVNLLPDLPDYETAVNDPRYAKKPPLDSSSNAVGAGSANGGHADNSNLVFTSAHSSTIGLPPPPPYSAVAAAGSVTVIGNTMPIPDVVSSPMVSSQTQQQAQPATTAATQQNEQQLEHTPSTHNQSQGSELANHISDTVVIESPPPAHATTTAIITIDH